MSDPAPPVDTLEEPHEPVVAAPTSLWMWVVVLGGPAIWFGHFMVVYLTAEAVCTPRLVGSGEPSEQLWSNATIDAFVLLATIAATGACVVDALVARRRARAEDGDGLWWVGGVLAVGSALAVIAVGVPALVVGPC